MQPLTVVYICSETLFAMSRRPFLRCAFLAILIAIASGQFNDRAGRAAKGQSLRQALESGAQVQQADGSELEAASRDAHAEEVQLQKSDRRQAVRQTLFYLFFKK